jgi:hypothetical protein
VIHSHCYDSRLNTYLELKTENEQLQQRLLELRDRASVLPSTQSTAFTHSEQSVDPLSHYQSLDPHSGGFENILPCTASSFTNNIYDTGTVYTYPSIAPQGTEEDNEEGSKKKKV